MTSPVTPSPVPAVNLTLHWVTEQDLVDGSIAAVKVRLPDWVPAEAHTEVVLLEAVALQVAQEVFSLNQIPPVVFEAILEMNGVTRQTGLPASGVLLIDSSLGLTGNLSLPLGSRFRVPLPDGTSADLLTSQDTLLTSGVVAFPVPVTAELPGTGPNAVAPGTPAPGVGVPTWVEQAVVSPGGLSGGIDPESDVDFWTRGAALLRRKPSALVVAQAFADAAMEHQEVGRAAAWSLWDGTGAAVGSKLGYVTVAVTDTAGNALPAPAMASIQADLAAQAQAGLTTVVVAPTYAAVTATVTVTAAPGVVKADLQAALAADLQAWLSPLTWPWGTAVTTNALVIRAGMFPGVTGVTATGGTGWTGPAASPKGLPAANPTVTVTVS